MAGFKSQLCHLADSGQIISLFIFISPGGEDRVFPEVFVRIKQDGGSELLHSVA